MHFQYTHAATSAAPAASAAPSSPATRNPHQPAHT